MKIEPDGPETCCAGSCDGDPTAITPDGYMCREHARKLARERRL